MIIYYTEASQFTAAALRDQNVKEVAVYEAGDCVLVAYLTENIFTKSCGDVVYKRVTLLANLYFEKEVYVSRDADVFFMLKEGTEKGAQRAKELILTRNDYRS